MKCVDCKYIGTCKEKAKMPNLGGCTSGIPVEKMGIKTNGDRIRAMTNEELAEFIEKAKMCGAMITRETTSVECCDCTYGFCKNVSEWLESEVENG